VVKPNQAQAAADVGGAYIRGAMMNALIKAPIPVPKGSVKEIHLLLYTYLYSKPTTNAPSTPTGRAKMVPVPTEILSNPVANAATAAYHGPKTTPRMPFIICWKGKTFVGPTGTLPGSMIIFKAYSTTMVCIDNP